MAFKKVEGLEQYYTGEPEETALEKNAEAGPHNWEQVKEKVATATPGQYVDMTDPEGKHVLVDQKFVEQAKAEGAQPETPEQTAVREYVDSHKGLDTDVQIALEQFADEQFFGIPEMIGDAQMDPLALAKKEALKKDHEFANSLGGVAGFGASLLAGGPLFKGAAKVGKAVEGTIAGTRAAEEVAAHALGEKLATVVATESGKAAVKEAAPSLIRTILAKSAGMGAEGALISAPKAVTEAALGDPEQAAETILWGFGTGAAFGGISSLGSIAKEKVSELNFGKMFSNKAEISAAKSLNMIKPDFNQLAKIEGGIPKAGRFLLEEDLVPRVGEDWASVAERVKGTKSNVGSQIGAVYDELAPAGELFKASDLSKEMREKVLAPLQKQAAFKAEANRIEDFINTFDEIHGDKSLNYKQLHAERMGVQSKAFKENGTIANSIGQPLKEIRDIFTSNLRNKFEEAADIIGSKSDYAERLKDLEYKYQVLKVVEKGVAKNVGRDLANRDHGITDYLLGEVGESVGQGIGAATGTLVGGPIGSVVGAGTAMMLNKGMRTNYHRITARLFNGALFSEQAMKNAAEKLDAIPTILAAMGANKTNAVAIGVNGFQKFLGANEHETKREQFDDISATLTKFVSNPAKTIDTVAKLTAPIASEGAPNIAGALNSKLIQSFNYLYENLPKAPGADSPFAPRKWSPTAKEMSDFEKRIAVVADPNVVLEHLQDGTLTRIEVDTLKSIYPKVYQTMLNRIVQFGASGKATALPYKHRIKLGLFTGDDLDPSLAASKVSALQATFTAPSDKSDNVKAKIEAPEMGTDIDRISNR